ncbi:MAG: phosphoribosylaminoimidazolesuccinocarboxamide synthase [Elusimicrobia bacterium]|nr:phosphoribosylaminoimidazolesuccinocarboxamide synthase [Elusimicrobiota bacterium]
MPKNWKHIYSGKVRDLYEVDAQTLALVASDRISAFDWVLPDTIEDKGKVLTQISKYWFDQFQATLPNHWLREREADEVPADLAKRTMLVKKVEIFPFEFIVRGYLAGSAWKSYQKGGKIGKDIILPYGLRWGQQLPEPQLTPTTKAREKGTHDEDIPWKTVVEALGVDKAQIIRAKILKLFNEAARRLEERGLILVDTKFELGEDETGQILLADEIFTPDSSRFWWRKDWEAFRKNGAVGELPPLDKQLVRDYLEKILKWDKKPPIPNLPSELINQTRATYLELFRAVTGKEPSI